MLGPELRKIYSGPERRKNKNGNIDYSKLYYYWSINGKCFVCYKILKRIVSVISSIVNNVKGKFIIP